MYRNLLPGSRLIRVSPAQAAGVTPISCTPVRTAGFGAMMVIVALASIAATGKAGLKVKAGEADDGSDGQDVANSLLTAADDQDNKMLVLDVHKPKSGQSVFTAIVTRETANVAIDGVFVLLYNPTTTPTVQDETVSAYKVLSEPSFGVAG